MSSFKGEGKGRETHSWVVGDRESSLVVVGRSRGARKLMKSLERMMKRESERTTRWKLSAVDPYTLSEWA